jgi:hypothetical protein
MAAGLSNAKGGRGVIATTKNEVRVQLGTAIKVSNSDWLAKYKAEARGRKIGDIVDEAIELLKKQEQGQIRLGF